MTEQSDVAAAIELLGNSRSPKRRQGAKRLRKLGDPAAGSVLLEALKKEVEDPRTWETQYQLVMAIGECGYHEALPFLRQFAEEDLEATMIYVGLGDAIARLQMPEVPDAAPIMERLRSNCHRSLLSGALRTLAMLRIVPSDAEIIEIIDFVTPTPVHEGLQFWVAAAAAGWCGDAVTEFLSFCEEAGRDDLADAARRSRQGKYKNWRPA